MSCQHSVLRLHPPAFRLVQWLPPAKTPRSAISKHCCVTAISCIMLNGHWNIKGVLTHTPTSERPDLLMLHVPGSDSSSLLGKVANLLTK